MNTAVCCLCSMDLVREQLEQLTKEIAAKEAQAEAAWQKYLNATDDSKLQKLEKRYEELKKKGEQLLDQRSALQTQLLDPGECSPCDALVGLAWLLLPRATAPKLLAVSAWGAVFPPLSELPCRRGAL